MLSLFLQLGSRTRLALFVILGNAFFLFESFLLFTFLVLAPLDLRQVLVVGLGQLFHLFLVDLTNKPTWSDLPTDLAYLPIGVCRPPGAPSMQHLVLLLSSSLAWSLVSGHQEMAYARVSAHLRLLDQEWVLVVWSSFLAVA